MTACSCLTRNTLDYSKPAGVSITEIRLKSEHKDRSSAGREVNSASCYCVSALREKLQCDRDLYLLLECVSLL